MNTRKTKVIPDVIAVLEGTRNAGNIVWMHSQIEKAIAILKGEIKN
jgi:hypothetical protein